MMCSVREMELGDDHDGIIEAPAEAKVGDPIAGWLGADDPVVDFEVTPNRPDTNGVNGVARDLASASLGKLITPHAGTRSRAHLNRPQKIGHAFPGRRGRTPAPHFAGRYVKGVKNGPSPQNGCRTSYARSASGLSMRLSMSRTTCFLRPRATATRLRCGQAEGGNSRPPMVANGESYLAHSTVRNMKLDETMTVIADDNGVLRTFGGIMGGEDDGVHGGNRQMFFIECAYFDPSAYQPKRGANYRHCFRCALPLRARR